MSPVIKIKHFRILVKPISYSNSAYGENCISALAPPPVLSHFVHKDRGKNHQQQSPRHSYPSLGHVKYPYVF